MTSKEFTQCSRQIVYDYTLEHLDKSDDIQFTIDNVYIVWQCYILGNIKALLSTTLFDGMYYEVTYNSKTDELYLDAYKKWDNKCFKGISSYEHFDDKQTCQKVIVLDPEIIEIGKDKLVYSVVACPRCGRHIIDSSDNWKGNYCLDCGQALDWSELKNDQ